MLRATGFILCAATAAQLIASLSPVAGSGAGSAASETQPTLVPVAELRIPFPEDDGTLTPYTFDLGYSLMTLVYDTVMWRDANGVPRPWLADSVATSRDGLTVTIKVDPRARWQDGPPVTSADIAFTFAYVRTHPHARFTPEVSAVTSVDTPDAGTAVIHLAHASSGFNQEPLADLPILPQHIWSDLPAGTVAPPGLPVGSGPYEMVGHTPGTGYHFEAVHGYFRGDPAVKSIDVPIDRDAPSTISELERGGVDALPSNLSADAVTQLERDLGVRVASGPSFMSTVLVINTRSAPFDRTDVRRAVSEALNLPQIASAVRLATPADQGYLDPDSIWAPLGDVQHYDPSAARSVLGSLDTQISVLAPNNDPEQQEAGSQVVQALQRAGADSRLTKVPPNELNAAVGITGEEPSYQLAIWTGPALATYDPGMLARLFGSGQPLNVTGYASQAFDGEAAQIDLASNMTERKAAIKQAVDQLADDAPVVPLYFPKGEFGYRPTAYDGWVYVKGSGILDKLSFVEPAVPRSGDATASSNATNSTNSAFLVIAVALALAALGLAGYGAFRWSRRV